MPDVQPETLRWLLAWINEISTAHSLSRERSCPGEKPYAPIKSGLKFDMMGSPAERNHW